LGLGYSAVAVWDNGADRSGRADRGEDRRRVQGQSGGPFEDPSATVADALFGSTWETENGRQVTEWQADASYLVTTGTGGLLDRGQSDTEGDVLIFITARWALL